MLQGTYLHTVCMHKNIFATYTLKTISYQNKCKLQTNKPLSLVTLFSIGWEYVPLWLNEICEIQYYFFLFQIRTSSNAMETTTLNVGQPNSNLPWSRWSGLACNLSRVEDESGSIQGKENCFPLLDVLLQSQRVYSDLCYLRRLCRSGCLEPELEYGKVLDSGPTPCSPSTCCLFSPALNVSTSPSTTPKSQP